MVGSFEGRGLPTVHPVPHTQKVPVRAGPGGTDGVRCVLPFQAVSELSLSTVLAMTKAAKDNFTTPTLRKLT